MKSRSRVLLAVFLVLLVSCDHTCSSYGKVVFGRTHMQHSRLVAPIMNVQYNLNELYKHPFLQHGWEFPDDVPLSEYENYDHLLYEGEDEAPEFGYINPDGTPATSLMEEDEQVDETDWLNLEFFFGKKTKEQQKEDAKNDKKAEDAEKSKKKKQGGLLGWLSQKKDQAVKALKSAHKHVSKHVNKVVKKVSKHVNNAVKKVKKTIKAVHKGVKDKVKEVLNKVTSSDVFQDTFVKGPCGCSAKDIGSYKGSKQLLGNLAGERCRDWDKSGDKWCFVNEPSKCKDYRLHPGTSKGGSAKEQWRRCNKKSDERMCAPAGKGKQYEVMAKLGMPRDGLFKFSGWFFRHNGETNVWEVSNNRDLSKDWHTSTVAIGMSSTPQAVKDMLNDLVRVHAVPIASSDVLEVLSCPDKGGLYEYDAGPLVTPLWFKFNDRTRQWKWSPDKTNWMPTATYVVTGGKYKGKKPVLENRDIIDALEVYQATGKSSLPEHFGETWLQRTIREKWRKLNAAVIGKIKEWKRKLIDFKNKIKSIDFRALADKVKSIGKDIANMPKGRALKTILYGFVNGVFVGLLDTIVNAKASCPSERIAAAKKEFKDATENLVQKFKDFFSNLHFHTIIQGVKGVSNAVGRLIKAVMGLINSCPALRDLFLMFIGMIAIMFIANVAIIATGYGAIFKVLLAIVTLLLSAKFIIERIVTVVKNVPIFLKSTEKMVKEDTFMIILQSLFEVIGTIVATIFLLKGVQGDLAQSVNSKALRGLATTKFGKMLGLNKMIPKLANAFKASKLKGLSEAAKSAENARRMATRSLALRQAVKPYLSMGTKLKLLLRKLPWSIRRGYSNVKSIFSNIFGHAGDGGTIIGFIPWDHISHLIEIAGISKLAFELINPDKDLLKERRASRYRSLTMTLARTRNAKRLSAQQVEQDDKRWGDPKGPQPPVWAAEECPGGIYGVGFPFQRVWFDKGAKVWRYGPKAIDPDSGRSVAGQPVRIRKHTHGRGVKQYIDINICDVNPLFCRGPPISLCRKAYNKIIDVEACPKDYLTESIPRRYFPKFSGSHEELRERLSGVLGVQVKMTKKRGDPDKFTPTLAQISLEDVAIKGDEVAVYPDLALRTLQAPVVSNDGYIITHHTTWAAYKWGKRLKRNLVFYVYEIDEPAYKVFRYLKDKKFAGALAAHPEEPEWNSSTQ